MADRQLVRGVGVGAGLTLLVGLGAYVFTGLGGAVAPAASVQAIELDLTDAAKQKVEQDPTYCPQEGDIEPPPPYNISYTGKALRPQKVRWYSFAGKRYTWRVYKKAGSKEHLQDDAGNSYDKTFKKQSPPTKAPPNPDGRSVFALKYLGTEWEWHYSIDLMTDACAKVTLDPDIYIDK